MPASNEEVELPGFNVPLSTDESTMYPTLDWFFARPLTTTREFDMQRAMDSITDKPDWTKKVFTCPSFRILPREIHEYTTTLT